MIVKPAFQMVDGRVKKPVPSGYLIAGIRRSMAKPALARQSRGPTPGGMESQD
jgi:hypothetical protein